MVGDLSVREFSERLASNDPTPGGGSAAALAGALGAGLVSMVCNFTVGRERYADVEEAMREVLGRAEQLRGELERVRKEARKPKAAAEPEFVAYDKEGPVLIAEVRALKGGELRDLSDRLKHREAALAVLLGSVDDGRAFLVVNLDRSLPDQGVDAVAVVREVAPVIGGGGGGRATLAEAGGKHPERVGEALAAAKKAVLAKLG